MRGAPAVVIVGLAVAAAGCDRRHPWPDDVQRSFLESCTARAPRDACECTLDELRKTLTYEQFTAVEKRTAETGTPTAELQEAASRCR